MFKSLGTSLIAQGILALARPGQAAPREQWRSMASRRGILLAARGRRMPAVEMGPVSYQV